MSETRTIAAHNRVIMNLIAAQSQQGTACPARSPFMAWKFVTGRKG